MRTYAVKESNDNSYRAAIYRAQSIDNLRKRLIKEYGLTDPTKPWQHELLVYNVIDRMHTLMGRLYRYDGKIIWTPYSDGSERTYLTISPKTGKIIGGYEK